MKKITYFPIFISVFLLILLAVTNVDATGSTISLDQDQKVIVDQNVGGESVKSIGKSGYYSIAVGDLKKSNPSSDIEINPVKKYRQNLAINDPLEPQAYLSLLGASSFWDNAPDSSARVIALIDGGIALNHQDLVGRWSTNDLEMGATATEGPTPNCTSKSLTLDKSCNNIDDDYNGYIDDWRGWDFSGSDNDPMVGVTNPNALGVNHATLIAGMMGAAGNNATGVASLNWQSKILPIQIFSDDGAATTLELAEAISYAIDQNVDVINLSLGSDGVDPTIEALLELANENNIIVVTAVGNCSGEFFAENGCSYDGQVMYPATSQYAIAVGATDLDDNWANFSSRGVELDVVAPGLGAIRSTDYLSINAISAYSDNMFGTSYSTPIVSGLMAVLKSSWPSATVSDLRAVLVDSTYRPSGMATNIFTSEYGFGRIQPVNALARANACKSITLSSDINCDGSVNLFDLSLLSSQWLKNNTGRTDSNLSGSVDLLDLSLLASKWGQ